MMGGLKETRKSAAADFLRRAELSNQFQLLTLPMPEAGTICLLISLADQSSQSIIQTMALVGKLIKTNPPITSQQR
jgi:hypothetical protein